MSCVSCAELCELYLVTLRPPAKAKKNTCIACQLSQTDQQANIVKIRVEKKDEQSYKKYAGNKDF